MHYELVKRKDSPNWHITWTERRRSRRCTTGTPDREQAELVLAAFRLERAKGPDAKPAQVSIVSLLDEYYESHAKAKPSAEQAKIAIDHLTRFFGASMVSAVTQGAIADYAKQRREEFDAKQKDWERKRPLSNDTIIRELTVLAAALHKGVIDGKMAYAPSFKKPTAAAPREAFLTRRQVAKLLRTTKLPKKNGKLDLSLFYLRTFIRIAFYTGARKAAILELTWDRVDFESRLIYLAVPSRAQTNKRRATVPLDGALYTALLRARKRARSKWVIEDSGQRLTSIRRSFATACVNAGVPWATPNTLRHSAGTAMAQSHVPLWHIAGMLGHTRTSTTERYLKHHPDFLRDAARGTLRGNRAPKARQTPAKSKMDEPEKTL